MKCSFQYLALIGMLAAIDVTEPGRYNQVGDFHKFVGDDGPMPLQSVQFILVPREGDLLARLSGWMTRAKFSIFSG